MGKRDLFWTNLASTNKKVGVAPVKNNIPGERKNHASHQNDFMAKRDLLFCSLGDGLTVFDRNVEKNGNYELLAHIDKDREITYYARVAQDYKKIIGKVARNVDPDKPPSKEKVAKISNSNKPQTIEKVFIGRPVEQNQNDVDLSYITIHNSPVNPNYFTEHTMTKRDLMFSSLGNGLTVSDRLHEEHGDYMKVAHINKDREITYYVIDLAKEYKERIEIVAKTSDPSISQTQEDKVFRARPDQQEQGKEEYESFSPR